MTTTALMSELEALNLMLTAADEDPVQSASQPGHLPLSIAKGVLDNASRLLQTRGWAFNTEYEYPLTRAVGGDIPLPANTLSIDVDDTFSSVDAVQRGLALYDRKGHTSVFTQDLTGTLITLLPWDQLPQAVRYYLAVHASRVYQVRMQAGEAVFKFSEEEEMAAFHALQSFETDTSDPNFLRDSWSVAQVLQLRED